MQCLSVSLAVNCITILLVLIYRSPSLIINLFLSDFATFLELLLATPSCMMIILYSDSIVFQHPYRRHLRCSCTKVYLISVVCQYVAKSTHLGEQILDLVFARSTDNLVLDCHLSHALSYHFAVHWFVKAARPTRRKKTVTYRKLRTTTPSWLTFWHFHFSRRTLIVLNALVGIW